MNTLSLTALMYHYVRDPAHPADLGSGILGLPLDRFAAQLEYVIRHYAVVSWPDVRAHLLGGPALPPNACLLTFDDGVRDHYLNVFPILRARNLSGLFFALARQPGDPMALGHKLHFLLARLGLGRLRQEIWRHLDDQQCQIYMQAAERYRSKGAMVEVDVFKHVVQRDLLEEAEAITSLLFSEHIGVEAQVADAFYLNSEQIAEMAAGGMYFGGHSRSHPWFDAIASEREADEISASAEWLGSVAPGSHAFAYPYGGYSATAPPLLRAHGFVAAFTTEPAIWHTDVFQIGRIDADTLPHPPVIALHMPGSG